MIDRGPEAGAHDNYRKREYVDRGNEGQRAISACKLQRMHRRYKVEMDRAGLVRYFLQSFLRETRGQPSDVRSWPPQRMTTTMTERKRNIRSRGRRSAIDLRTRKAAKCNEGTSRNDPSRTVRHFPSGAGRFLYNIGGNHATKARGPGSGAHDHNQKRKGRRWRQHEGRSSDSTWMRRRTHMVE